MHDSGVDPVASRKKFWDDAWSWDESPWQYGESNSYETTKYGQTLSMLPQASIGRALELACADGHFTIQLAANVDHLIATDISAAAVDQARSRCAGARNIDFQVLDFISDELPADLDLLVCSEVLYFTPREELPRVAEKFASSVKIGGHILMTHAFLVSDDRDSSGFDWGLDFGAKTIGAVFSNCPGLALVKELRTSMYSVLLFRRFETGVGVPPPARELIEAPNASPLPPHVERLFIWDGVVCTREEAKSNEVTNQVPILMYHSIASDGPPELSPYRVSPEMFEQQMRFLRRHGYHSISLTEWASCISSGSKIPGRPVIITFDDGYKNVLTHAAPILEAADFRATVFVVTGKVGGAADWDANWPPPQELMDWDDLRLLQQRGHEIGSHTTSHVELLSLSDEDIVRDSLEARAALHEQLGREVTSIAFPWGQSDARVRNALNKGGFQVMLGTTGGYSNLKDDVFNLPRIEIHGQEDIERFADRLRTARIESCLRYIEQLTDAVGNEAREREICEARRHELNGKVIAQTLAIEQLESCLARYQSVRFLFKSLAFAMAYKLRLVHRDSAT